MKLLRIQRVAILIIILAAVLSRLPILKSANMILDIDECTVGMMARHQYLYGEISPFFWGQAYGFSLVETSAITLSYMIGGISDEATKLAMLGLWIVGAIYFYKALVQVNKRSQWTPFLLILLFILSPAWSIWSMKARGGYITAFTLSSILMYLLFHKKHGKRNIAFLIAGALLAIIFEAQAFWIPGLAPLVLYRLVQEKSRRKWLCIALSGLLCFAGFTIYKIHLPHNHDPMVFWLHDFWWNILRMPHYLYSNQHAIYFFYFVNKPNACTSAFAMISSAVIFVLIITGIIGLFRKDKDWLFISVVAGMVLTLFYTFFTFWEEPRYLLPINALYFLALQLFLNKVKRLQLFHGIIIALSIFGAFAIYSLRDFSFYKTKKDELLPTLQYLEDQNIRYVYTTDWILQWQIMYYSNEQVIARQIEIPDRCPVFNKSVDKAMYLHKPVAVVGYSDAAGSVGFNRRADVMLPGYYIFLNPSQGELAKTFILWPRQQFFR